MGESYGPCVVLDEAAMLDLGSTANVDRRFHTGEQVTMRKTVRMAKAVGVLEETHPSFLDFYGFRRFRFLTSGQKIWRRS